MKNIKTTLLTISAALFLIACNKELEIDFPDADQNIVANSIINNREPISIELSQSLRPGLGTLDEIEVKEVTTASIQLFENDALVETLQYSKHPNDVLGKYRSSIIPQLNHSYSLKIMDSDFDLIKGTTTIPQPPKLQNFFGDIISTQWEEIKQLVFSFTIDDPKEENYYYFYIDIPVKAIENSGDTILHLYRSSILDLDDESNKQLYLNNGFVFSDENFNGNHHIITGQASVNLRVNDILQDNDFKDAFVDISNIRLTSFALAKETYQFYISHSLYLTNQYEFYAEPITIFSNIENGLGIFGGTAIAEKIVELN